MPSNDQTTPQQRFPAQPTHGLPFIDDHGPVPLARYFGGQTYGICRLEIARIRAREAREAAKRQQMEQVPPKIELRRLYQRIAEGNVDVANLIMESHAFSFFAYSKKNANDAFVQSNAGALTATTAADIRRAAVRILPFVQDSLRDGLVQLAEAAIIKTVSIRVVNAVDLNNQRASLNISPTLLTPPIQHLTLSVRVPNRPGDPGPYDITEVDHLPHQLASLSTLLPALKSLVITFRIFTDASSTQHIGTGGDRASRDARDNVYENRSGGHELDAELCVLALHFQELVQVKEKWLCIKAGPNMLGFDEMSVAKYEENAEDIVNRAYESIGWAVRVIGDESTPEESED